MSLDGWSHQQSLELGILAWWSLHSETYECFCWIKFH